MLPHCQAVFSFWDDSTDFWRHVDPIWNVISTTAKYADALAEVRIELYAVEHENTITPGSTPLPGVPGWHDTGGAFSEMHYQ